MTNEQLLQEITLIRVKHGLYFSSKEDKEVLLEDALEDLGETTTPEDVINIMDSFSPQELEF